MPFPMATLAFALLIAVTLSAPAPPPGGPCPKAPANYCDCGIGVNTKWLCRANNGYVWETNDEAPKDPCPAKYPQCTTHPGEMVSEMAPAPPLCFHMEDVEDHKCFEACSSEGTFKTKGISATGTCPAKYNSVDTTKTVLQCPDGVTNVRYCAATALNVTIATKGEAGMAAMMAMDATIGYVHQIEHTPGDHCLEIAYPGGDASPFWKSDGYKYSAPDRPEWKTGACDRSTWKSVDETMPNYDNWTATTNAPFGAVIFSKYGYSSQMVSEMAPATPLCFHMEDVEDHKCFEACSSEGTFKTKGISATGTCPAKYNSVDTTKTVLQCPDGVTNVRYCAATALNVTIATKGEAGGFEALMAISEAGPAPPPLVKHLNDPKEPHCSDLTIDFSMESDLDQVKEWWSSKEYMYKSWTEGPCDAKFNSIDHVEHPIGVAGVTTREKGIKQSTSMQAATPAPPPLVKHLNDPKEPHCSDLTIDFSMESDLDQVKEWWSSKEYMYKSWAEGPCDAKFNSIDHVEHPIGVAGVTTREKGIKQLLVEILEQ